MLDIGVEVLHRMRVGTRRHSSCPHEGRIHLTAGGRDTHLLCQMMRDTRLRAGLARIMSHAGSHMVTRGDAGVLHAT